LITQALPLTAFIAALAAGAFVLEHRVPALSKVGASLLTLVFGALVSNVGLVPAASPVYDVISGPVTMLAIAWLLLAVNLSDVKKVGIKMFSAFGLAVGGTALGAFVGAVAFAPALGENAWRLAGVFTGTYSGGSVNFVSVGRVVELPATLWSGATAADALTTGIWMAATLLIPVWLGRFFTPVPKERRGETVRRVVALTCAEPPGEATHGTGRAMAKAKTADPILTQLTPPSASVH